MVLAETSVCSLLQEETSNSFPAAARPPPLMLQAETLISVRAPALVLVVRAHSQVVKAWEHLVALSLLHPQMAVPLVAVAVYRFSRVLLLEAHPAVLALPVVPRLVAMAVPFKSARAKATVVLVVLCL
jgi:hypothetical protein